MSNTLQVGVSKQSIVFPHGFLPYDGFSSFHDPLNVRTLVVQVGNRLVAWIVVELTSLPNPVVKDIKQEISTRYQISEKAVFLSVSHTFSAPHIQMHTKPGSEEDHKSKALLQSVRTAVGLSMEEALSRRQPACVGFGKGLCDVNVNRDMLTCDGWWKGSNPSGKSDKTVAMLCFKTLQGKSLAILVNYAVQSSVLEGSCTTEGDILISSDLAGWTSSYVEQELGGGAVVLFTLSGGGDQDPNLKANRHHVDSALRYTRHDVHESGFALLEILAEKLGDEILRCARSPKRMDNCLAVKLLHTTLLVPGQKIYADIHTMKPTKVYRYEESEPVAFSVDILLLNAVALVAVPVELNAKTVLQIKAGSPYSNTIVCTMVNGGLKYLPDQESYDKITYGSMNSYIQKGGAELLVQAVLEMLGSLALDDTIEESLNDY